MQQEPVKLDLRLLTPDQVRNDWAFLSGILKSVEPYCNGEVMVEDVPALVDARRAFVLVLLEDGKTVMVGVMEIIHYPRKTVMNTIMLAGRGAKRLFTDCRDKVAYIARELDASCIRGYVRPSMSRFLKRATPRAKEVCSVVEIEL